MNLIGVFNKENDNINKGKMPEGILSNSIYHIVENPSSEDIIKIIYNLFIRMDFGNDENLKYTKNYLIEKGIEKEEIEVKLKILKNPENPSFEGVKVYFQKQFEEAKKLEAEDFTKKFLDLQLFIINETTNESKFSLNDIKNYIDLRESVPKINYLLIQFFIFVYHFSKEENINKITEKLYLMKNIEFSPVIDYDEGKKYLVIKIEKESIRIKVNNPEKINTKKNKKLFDTLTKPQKHCFIFLICCIISRKTPIIQGPAGSGKSYLLSVLSILLGQDTNLYQLNSNAGISIITGQDIIKEDFDECEKEKICEAYNEIKDIIKYKKSFNAMNLNHYKKIITKIDN